MSKGLEALEKIDHTICMNNLANNIKWDIDKYDHCACVSVEDFVECYEIIEKELNALEIIKERDIDMHDIRVYSYSYFNYRRSERGLITISKEEYDLLKRCCYE